MLSVKSFRSFITTSPKFQKSEDGYYEKKLKTANGFVAKIRILDNTDRVKDFKKDLCNFQPRVPQLRDQIATYYNDSKKKSSWVQDFYETQVKEKNLEWCTRASAINRFTIIVEPKSKGSSIAQDWRDKMIEPMICIRDGDFARELFSHLSKKCRSNMEDSFQDTYKFDKSINLF